MRHDLHHKGRYCPHRLEIYMVILVEVCHCQVLSGTRNVSGVSWGLQGLTVFVSAKEVVSQHLDSLFTTDMTCILNSY